MNFPAVPPLISSALFISLGLFVFLKNPRSHSNQAFGLMCLVTFWWQFSWFILFTFGTEKLAKIMVHVGYTSIIFIPYAFYHFFVIFLKRDKEKFLVLCAYLLGFIFLFFNWTSDLYIKGYYKYPWGYYPKAGLLHPIYLLSLFSIAIRIVYLLYKELSESKFSPFNYNQIKYILLAFISYTLASSDFAVNYGLGFYPIGFIFIMVSLGIMAYTIVKYRLMDIKVALTRTGIFIIVYALVLGFPFWIGLRFLGTGLWILPISIMAILATIGPFIYIYIDHRAEERLLKEQRRYQNTLKQASVGMTRIRNLRRLLDLITHIVTRAVRIAYAGIYLYNDETNEFILQVCRDKGRMPIPKLTSDNPLINWITLHRQPLVYEEVKRVSEDTNDATYKRLEENMRLLTAMVVIPSFLENRFLGFFALGEKLSGQIYTPEDLNVFEVLAAQAALAIENAKFYEETQKMQEQIATAEKMATIGTMADGLSHQINNRFYALSLIAGDTIDTIKTTDTSNCSPEVKEAFRQITHALERVKTNVIQGGEVVEGILKYTRKGEEGFEPLTLDQILDSTLDMVQYKVKLSEIEIIRNYPQDLPKIKGNSVQLQEAFFNFVDNGYDSTVERKTILKEAGYRGRLTFSAQAQEDATLLITIEDNGMGIKEENKKRLFTPFFTTKVSSHQGTGLGLYVVKRVIEEFHKGKIWFASEYGKGTKFFLQLPIAKECT